MTVFGDVGTGVSVGEGVFDETTVGVKGMGGASDLATGFDIWPPEGLHEVRIISTNSIRIALTFIVFPKLNKSSYVMSFEINGYLTVSS